MQNQTFPLLGESRADIEKSSVKKLNGRIIPICYIIILLCYIDRGNLSFAANQFCKDINISYSEYGTGASLFYITYVLFQIPSNIILKKTGAPIWLCFLLVFWGLVAMAMALTQNVTHYYTLRLLLGLAEAGTFPGIFYYITSIYPYKYTSIVFGYVISAALVATPVSSPIAAALLSMDKILGISGWQWLFIVEGSFPLIFAIFVYLVLPKDIESTKLLYAEEKEYVKSNLLKSKELDDINKIDDVWAQIKSVITSGEIWMINIFDLLMMTVFNVALYFSTLIISDLLNVTSSSDDDDDDSETCSSTSLGVYPTLLSAIPYSISAIVALIFAKYITKMKYRPIYMAIDSGIGALALFIWLFNYENVVIGISVLTIAVTVAYGCNLTLLVSFISSKFNQETSAVGFAIFNSVGMIGGFIGPLIAGYIIDYYGFFWCIFCAACLLLSSISIAFFMKENYINDIREETNNHETE